MKLTSWVLLAIAGSILASCVALPAQPLATDRTGAAATTQPASGAATAVPAVATMTPAPLPTIGTPAATPSAPPTVTRAPGATPGPYGHAADYSWLAGKFTISGACQMIEYDPTHGDAHGGATFVTFSGVNAPANGSFVRVEGRFIESERPVYPNCPDSTYLVSKVVPAPDGP